MVKKPSTYKCQRGKNIKKLAFFCCDVIFVFLRNRKNIENLHKKLQYLCQSVSNVINTFAWSPLVFSQNLVYTKPLKAINLSATIRSYLGDNWLVYQKLRK